MPPKPTVLFIPGAWFKVAAYNIFLSSLRNIGYPVTASEYPSLNPAPNDHDIGCARDTSYLRDKFLLPLVDEQSKDVVLVMHSYGGMPGAGAAQGLSKKLRKRSGKDGGVVGLIMISALVVPPAISCAGSMGGDTSPWVIKDVPKPGLCWPENPTQIFMADVPLELANENIKQIAPHATKAFFSPQTPPASNDPELQGRLGFIVLSQDRAIPKAGQEAMMKNSEREWLVMELDASHNAPFISKVKETVVLLDDMIRIFTTK